MVTMGDVVNIIVDMVNNMNNKATMKIDIMGNIDNINLHMAAINIDIMDNGHGEQYHHEHGEQHHPGHGRC